MIWQILFIISVALLFILIIVNVWNVLNEPTDKISLKESLDLCNLPIVTFTNNNNKFNFMLDTGADRNHISKRALKKLKATDTEYMVETMGFTGDKEANPIKEAVFTYKKNSFEIELTVSPGLDKSFEFIKNRDGVTIHGILGNMFLREYGYILDFDKLEVYSKRKWKKR